MKVCNLLLPSNLLRDKINLLLSLMLQLRPRLKTHLYNYQNHLKWNPTSVELEDQYRTQIIILNSPTNSPTPRLYSVHRPISLKKLIFKLLVKLLFFLKHQIHKRLPCKKTYSYSTVLSVPLKIILLTRNSQLEREKIKNTQHIYLNQRYSDQGGGAGSSIPVLLFNLCTLKTVY